MSIGVFVWLLAGGSIAFVSVGYGFYVLAQQRKKGKSDAALVATVLETPARSIARVEGGEWVRVVGVVLPGKTIESPLEKVACVAYQSRVELVTEGIPMPLGSRRLSIEFVLEDTSGRARVVAGARHVLTSRRVHVLPTATAAFVGTHEVAGLGGAVAYEAALVPGARVAVVGLARWEADPEPQGDRPHASYRATAAPRRLVLEESALGGVVVTDDPRALENERTE